MRRGKMFFTRSDPSPGYFFKIASHASEKGEILPSLFALLKDEDVIALQKIQKVLSV